MEMQIEPRITAQDLFFPEVQCPEMRALSALDSICVVIKLENRNRFQVPAAAWGRRVQMSRKRSYIRLSYLNFTLRNSNKPILNLVSLTSHVFNTRTRTSSRETWKKCVQKTPYANCVRTYTVAHSCRYPE